MLEGMERFIEPVRWPWWAKKYLPIIKQVNGDMRRAGIKGGVQVVALNTVGIGDYCRAGFEPNPRQWKRRNKAVHADHRNTLREYNGEKDLFERGKECHKSWYVGKNRERLQYEWSVCGVVVKKKYIERTPSEQKERKMQADCIRWARRNGWECHFGNYRGTPDMFFFRDDYKHGEIPIWIEFKVNGNKLSAMQEVVTAKLRRRGHAVFVVYSLAELIEIFKEELWRNDLQAASSQ